MHQAAAVIAYCGVYGSTCMVPARISGDYQINFAEICSCREVVEMLLTVPPELGKSAGKSPRCRQPERLIRSQKVFRNISGAME